MLRRWFSQLSSRQSIGRSPRWIAPQMPYLLSKRTRSSGAAKQNQAQRPAPSHGASDGGSSFSKLVIGSVVVGAAALAAYETGYLNFEGMSEKPIPSTGIIDAKERSETLQHSTEETDALNKEIPGKLDNETFEKSDKTLSLDMKNGTKESLDVVAEEKVPSTEDNVPTVLSQEEAIPDEQTIVSSSSYKENSNIDEPSANTELNVDQHKTSEDSGEQNIELDLSTNVSQEPGLIGNISTEVTQEPGFVEVAHHDDIPKVHVAQDSEIAEKETQKSLLESYSLKDEVVPLMPRKEDNVDSVAILSTNKEVSVDRTENQKALGEDGKILLDVIEAIHAAEKKQAEADAYVLAEEKRKLKEKYEKELKDARARQLMYAEEAAILDKELSKEKAKAAATLKLLQEKAEKNLKEELQRKDEEAKMHMEKVQDLAKAELAAAIAKEKSSQIEKIAEANVNINALCMAFYARSEEARQTHSIHKLALGTLALEDALSKGLPIQSEVSALHKSLEGIDKDSLLKLALSSLPEDILKYGAVTSMQLNQKFDSLKRPLRHLSLIPAGGGGLLAHVAATVASSIKMKEDHSGDGIESLISRVEHFLVDGKFAEAAEVLEAGVRGTEAQEVIVEWVQQARNRAIAEQALSLLQSYAMPISFS